MGLRGTEEKKPMELTNLQGNPIKGVLPTWEHANFQTDDGCLLITVWRNTATGLMEATLAERSDRWATWGAPIRFDWFD